MGNTTIQWTDYTVNFWHGCRKVNEDCKYCYMYRDKERYKQNPYEVVKRDFKAIRNELKKLPTGMKIFTCSWSDFFIEEADLWRDEALQIIAEHPQFIWQILTKRPERVNVELPDNVWLLFSAGTQPNFDKFMPVMKNIKAKVKGISIEPLTGRIDFANVSNRVDAVEEWGQDVLRYIDWVIVGGESGNDTGKYLYRPCELEWIEKIVNDCKSSNTPVFVKQMGTYLSKQLKMSDRHGGNINEFPEQLRVREFPTNTGKGERE